MERAKYLISQTDGTCFQNAKTACETECGFKQVHKDVQLGCLEMNCFAKSRLESTNINYHSFNCFN